MAVRDIINPIIDPKNEMLIKQFYSEVIRRIDDLENNSAGGGGPEVNDLTSSVTWTNVPEENITGSPQMERHYRFVAG